MFDFFYNLSPLWQAILASLIPFTATTIGASFVYILKKDNKHLMDIMLSVSAGIMFAAAIFSLLLPSIEQAKSLGFITYLVVPISIILGSVLLFIGDKLTTKFFNLQDKNGNCLLLVISIILHNIPEGLAIGLAFGSIAHGIDGASVSAAMSLTLGIAIQNMPEGAAISLPLKRSGFSNNKAFSLGLLSATIEPLSAIIGVLLALKIKFFLPFMLAFAAGAMILVVVKELIPESQNNDNKSLMAFLTLVGFIFMLILELI